MPNITTIFGDYTVIITKVIALLRNAEGTVITAFQTQHALNYLGFPTNIDMLTEEQTEKLKEYTINRFSIWLVNHSLDDNPLSKLSIQTVYIPMDNPSVRYHTKEECYENHPDSAIKGAFCIHDSENYLDMNATYPTMQDAQNAMADLCTPHMPITLQLKIRKNGFCKYYQIPILITNRKQNKTTVQLKQNLLDAYNDFKTEMDTSEKPCLLDSPSYSIKDIPYHITNKYGFYIIPEARQYDITLDADELK